MAKKLSVKECNLKVTVDILLRRTEFLDVSFDLETGKYLPYRKPNSELLYIHAQSNHPPTINANSKTIAITKNPLSSSAHDTSKNYDSSMQQDLSGINPQHIPTI